MQSAIQGCSLVEYFPGTDHHLLSLDYRTEPLTWLVLGEQFGQDPLMTVEEPIAWFEGDEEGRRISMQDGVWTWELGREAVGVVKEG